MTGLSLLCERLPCCFMNRTWHCIRVPPSCGVCSHQLVSSVQLEFNCYCINTACLVTSCVTIIAMIASLQHTNTSQRPPQARYVVCPMMSPKSLLAAATLDLPCSCCISLQLPLWNGLLGSCSIASMRVRIAARLTRMDSCMYKIGELESRKYADAVFNACIV
jgi:hypothetical protein